MEENQSTDLSLSTSPEIPAGKASEHEIIRLMGEKARKAQNKYMELLNSMREGFIRGELIRDEEGNAIDFRYLELNPECANLLGHNPAELVGHTCMEVFPSTQASAIRVIAEVVESKQPDKFVRFLKEIGKWFEGIAHPVEEQERFTILFNDITARVEAEEQLQEKEDLLRTALDSARMGVWHLDLEQQVCWGDARFLRLFGVPYAEEKIPLSVFTSLLAEESAAAVMRLLEENVYPGQEFDGEVKLRVGPDAGRRIRWRGKAEPDRPWILNGVSFDVTGQSLAEEALRYSEEKYHSGLEKAVLERTAELMESQKFNEQITQVSPYLITVHDVLSNQMIYANHNHLWDGIADEGDIRLKDIRSRAEILIDPYDQEKAAAFIDRRRQLKDDEIAETELRTVNNKQGWRWIRVRSKVFKRDEAGRASQIISFTSNITAEREAIDRLNDQLYFIGKITSTMPDMLSVIDLDTKDVIYLNNEAFTKNGFDSEDLKGMTAEERHLIVHEDDLAAVSNYFQNFKTYSDDDIQSLEYRAQTDAGEWVWFRVRGKVFRRDRNGIPYQSVNVIQNINELKNAEAALLEAEKLALIGKMTRTVAHEVRNPLSSIVMAVNFIRQEATLRQDRSLIEYTEMADRNAKRIDKLISDMLRIGKREHATRPVRINELLNEALTLIEDRLMMTGINVRKDYDFSGRIMLDHDGMLIALLSILSNAIESMQNKNKGELKISSSAQDDLCLITICDNGQGIPEGMFEKLFEPFVSTKTYGLGLGLYNAREIIGKNNGLIEVSTEQGIGTEFRLSFPLLPE